MRNIVDTKTGFAGQICTTDYEKLYQWANSEPKPQQTALQLFVEVAKAWQTANINHKCWSYTYKHNVEELSRRMMELNPNYEYEYIGNEDFIIGMIQAGFKIENSGTAQRPDPNYYFNLRLPKNWLNNILDIYRSSL